MASLTEQVTEKMKALPSEQQRDILRYVESLEMNVTHSRDSSQVTQGLRISQEEAIDKYAGSLKGGPSDLSTNKAYMEGFGSDSRREGRESSEETEKPISFAEAAREYIGCLDGPSDLSTNKAYLEGLGEE